MLSLPSCNIIAQVITIFSYKDTQQQEQRPIMKFIALVSNELAQASSNFKLTNKILFIINFYKIKKSHTSIKIKKKTRIYASKKIVFV